MFAIVCFKLWSIKRFAFYLHITLKRRNTLWSNLFVTLQGFLIFRLASVLSSFYSLHNCFLVGFPSLPSSFAFHSTFSRSFSHSLYCYKLRIWQYINGAKATFTSNSSSFQFVLHDCCLFIHSLVLSFFPLKYLKIFMFHIWVQLKSQELCSKIRFSVWMTCLIQIPANL